MILGYNLGPTMMFAVQPTLFTRMFGTKVRYTGLSFAYQFSAILGGLSPPYRLKFAGARGRKTVVCRSVFICCLSSFLCLRLAD